MNKITLITVLFFSYFASSAEELARYDPDQYAEPTNYSELMSCIGHSNRLIYAGYEVIQDGEKTRYKDKDTEVQGSDLLERFFEYLRGINYDVVSSCLCSTRPSIKLFSNESFICEVSHHHQEKLRFEGPKISVDYKVGEDGLEEFYKILIEAAHSKENNSNKALGENSEPLRDSESSS